MSEPFVPNEFEIAKNATLRNRRVVALTRDERQRGIAKIKADALREAAAGVFDTALPADLHIGHRFVSDLRGFNRVEEHDETIVDGIAQAVTKHDILWVLGDYSVSQHEHARALLSKLPCRLVLVPGNHDPEHPMHRAAWGHQKESMNTFNAILPYQRLRLSKTNFLMSHLPYHDSGDHTPGNRFNEYRLPNEGFPLLCGHVHDAWRFKGNQFNVGVDVNGFKPVKANTVLEWWEVES